MIYTHIESPDISRICKMLEKIPGSAHSVLLTTLRQTVPRVRNKLVELTSARFTVRKNDIKSAVTGLTLSRGASIRVLGKRIPMSHYRLTPARPVKKPKGLTAEVRRGHLEAYPRGFVAYFGGQPAMLRVAPGHNKGLKEAHGPGIPELVGGVVIEQLMEYAKKTFTELFYQRAKKVLLTPGYTPGDFD